MRRVTGLIALIVVFLAMAVLIYVDYRPRPPEAEAPGRHGRRRRLQHPRGARRRRRRLPM